MAASSPRCIQQILLNDSSIQVKPLSASPISSAGASSSYDSELDRSSTALVEQVAKEHTSTSSSPLPPDASALVSATSNLSTQFAVQALSPISSTHSSFQPATFNKSSQPWIAALLSTKFYGPCPKHPTLRKNDLNLFCTKHAAKICQYCHQSEHCQKSSLPCTVLHVSRYMYHDVLLAKEAANMLDIAEVQSYLNNGNRVVYIDRRAQPKSKLAPHAKACTVCSRTLQDPYRFCSVFCRLAHAKDPAAVASLPLPDACPLLQQTVRKSRPVSTSPMPTKRVERNIKRVERGMNEISIPTSPVTPSRPTYKSTGATPPLQLTTMKKRSRRKGEAIRSPIQAARCLIMLSRAELS